MVRSYSLEPSPEPRSYRVDYERELNPEQLAVVLAGDGPLLVLAGAGSGKTRTITYRVSRLIESGVDPAAILLVTFTNKAAREMLSRGERLIGEPARRVLGGTFHHVGHLILRRREPPHRRLAVPNHRELAKGTLRTLIREAGLTVDELAELLRS